MSKRIFIVIFLILPALSRACDICGCGIGNSYIGILPEFRKHIFGLRYRNNSMLTHIGVNGNYTYLTTKELFNTVEIWGGWNVSKNLRLMASLPFNVNKRENMGVSKQKSGIGDASVSGFFQMLNSRGSVGDNNILVQSLWIGGGVKLPTGEYNPNDKGTGSNDANLFQLGTGSWDFNLGLMYDIRLQDAGINLNSNYRITTENSHGYRYGNKISLSTQGYYKIKINHLSIAPNLGVQYEDSKSDTDNSFTVVVSGGNLLLGTVGVESVFKKIAVGANFQTPLSQNLANGIVRANNRLMIHVSFALSN